MTLPSAPTPPPTRKPKIPKWAQITLGVLAGLCVIGTISSALSGNDDPNPPSQPVAQSPASDTPANQEPQPQPTTEQPPPPAEPITVQGRGKQVVQLPATLNGTYLLEYTVNDNAFILVGLDASGQQSGWFSWLNELDFDANTLSGSTVVEANNVVMVSSDNVDGSWTLTFTKLS